MIKIGLTGGIGSGKSLVASLLEKMGATVFDSDRTAKELMNSNQELIDQIKVAFGDQVYQSGELNRKKLASIVFNDSEKLKTLNDLVHPQVGKAFDRWCDSQTADLLVKEAAILIESGAHKNLDMIILVTCPEEERVKRVVQRDGVEPIQVKKRIAKQWSDDKKKEFADYIIQNDGEQLLIPQVVKMFNDIKIKKNEDSDR